MNRNQRPCPLCGLPMHRQSPRCIRCRNSDPVWHQRMSDSRAGKPSYLRALQHRRKMSLAKMGNKSKIGLLDSPETREKKKAHWSPQKRELARLRGFRFSLDPDWRKKIAESVSGELNPNWEHGRSQIPYAPGWGKVNRRIVWMRAGFLCENCG